MKFRHLKKFISGDRSGFTLIELIVGLTVFVLVVGAIIGIFISGIRSQRELLAEQDALNQLSFAMEYMSRALRMARRENGTFNCLTTDFNYENPAGDSSIQFINHLQDDDCQKFFLDGKTLKYVKDAGVGGINEELVLTSPNIVIDELKFELKGEAKDDSPEPNSQPRITIFLETSAPLEIRLQTTISQRNLDI